MMSQYSSSALFLTAILHSPAGVGCHATLDVSPVILETKLAPVIFSLAAFLFWGTADFIGGYASRRTNAFLLTMIAHISGTLWMTSFAMGTHAAFPPRFAIGWALAAGLAGGAALAIFYRALSEGRMGVTAPIAAVLGAAIPVIFGIFTEGPPGLMPIAGFALAAVGIWLISRSQGSGPPGGIGWAVLSGIGFAGYFLCAKQAGNGSALWIAAIARVAGFLLTSVIVIAGKNLAHVSRQGLLLGITAGCMDVSGSVFFIRASQSGRLDSAVMISSLYPAVTVLLARFILKEHLTRWRFVGMLAAVAAVPLIASR